MKRYIIPHEWQISETTFNKNYNRISESLMSIGNSWMGQRANFEEYYSGDTLQGNYAAGVYYPDKTKVGWWKIGYPEYFAKVLNATNWIGLDILIDNERLDLNKVKIVSFNRTLNMQEGILYRQFEVILNNGAHLIISSERFCSIDNPFIATLQYTIKNIGAAIKLSVDAFLDGDVQNQDANYDENFWNAISSKSENNSASIVIETKKTAFHLATSMLLDVIVNHDKHLNSFTNHIKEKFANINSNINLKTNDTVSIIKYIGQVSSLSFDKHELLNQSETIAKSAFDQKYDHLKALQIKAWKLKWEESDIKIEGDIEAQQGIRFNIFHLYQTYSGQDARLNIGPKGFTGEKYGGSTYWDTEAYCLPFFQSTALPQVSKNLLMYRYNHLPKAIENAQKLGFNNGAALYPMVTMNGEECHNEWEITFEEIHRNGAIAYAIYDYINYTNDIDYLYEYGLEVLIGIARFWAQRVNWSHAKQQYVILGVTGPNEFENNVNNNWYTNKIAAWCLNYTSKCIEDIKINDPEKWKLIILKTNFDTNEINIWNKIDTNMYYPYDENLNIFLQQDGFLDKEQLSVNDLKPYERPIVEHWSWDRILRSIFIKQADVLQGIYFFEHEYDIETIKRNFDYYEAKTVHESSLSPCVHSILAAKISDIERAYEFYLRTSRLDIDDYNNDTKDGLHITSMAGTWLSIVKGFAGMRVIDGQLHFKPQLPQNWNSYSFNILFKNSLIHFNINKSGLHYDIKSGNDIEIIISK